MRQKRMLILIFLLAFSLLASACSNEEKASENKENDESTEVSTTEKEKKEEKSDLPSDKELFQVLYDNEKAFGKKDIKAYAATIHKESPVYEETVKFTEQIFEQDIHLETKLEDLKVIKKTKDTAEISYTQTTLKKEDIDFQNNRIEGTQILKLDKGKWKIYNTVPTKITNLDDNGNPIPEEVGGEALLDKVNFSIDNRNWHLDFFDEGEGNFIAEYVLENESVQDWSELYTIHYFKNYKTTLPKEQFLQSFEQSLASTVTGEFTFNLLSEDPQSSFFEFIIANDPVEDDQHEVGRSFYNGDDLYMVRYTKKGPAFDESTKDTWVKRLSEVTIK